MSYHYTTFGPEVPLDLGPLPQDLTSVSGGGPPTTGPSHSLTPTLDPTSSHRPSPVCTRVPTCTSQTTDIPLSHPPPSYLGSLPQILWIHTEDPPVLRSLLLCGPLSRSTGLWIPGSGPPLVPVWVTSDFSFDPLPSTKRGGVISVTDPAPSVPPRVMASNRTKYGPSHTVLSSLVSSSLDRSVNGNESPDRFL